MQATTIAAQGEAKTDYNLAGFNVTLDALKDTVPNAKAELKRKVEQFKAALDGVKTRLNLDFVKNSIRSSSNVQQQWEWETVKGKQQQVNKGYQATYSYHFQIDDLELVSKVYDALLSLTEVRVNAPYYAIKDSTRERLNKKALKAAFEKVTDRLETECGVLGLSPNDFEIFSWETSYSDSRRSDRVSARRSAGVAMAYSATLESVDSAMGGGAPDDDDSLELIAGQAVVTVNLEVGYSKKASQTVKAEVVTKKADSTAAVKTATAY